MAIHPGSVVGFPHGTQTTATKLYEARDLLRRGAKELDVVVAIPNLLSREFQYVQIELSQISELCHKEGATLKVILENAYLTDELKIIACRCCERAEVDFVATSTGFAPSGCTLADVKLMRQYLPDNIGVKAAEDCGPWIKSWKFTMPAVRALGRAAPRPYWTNGKPGWRSGNPQALLDEGGELVAGYKPAAG